MNRPRPYRSILWPIILIGVGLIWLLSSLGWIQQASLNTLVSLWPLILIVIGLDIIIGRRSAVASAIIGLAAVGVVVFVLMAAPALNLPASGGLRNREIVEALADTQSATVDLHLSSMPTRVHSLSSSETLLQANIDYYGTLDYSAEGTPVKHISLAQRNDGANFTFSFNPNARWDIGLSTAVPIELNIDGGSGSADIDLTGVQLTTLGFDQGSGSFDVILPMSPEEYTVDAVGGSGSLEIDLPGQTSMTLRLDGQSGSINLRLPDNAGVRLEVMNSGSGSVNFPGSLDLISGGEDKEGVWQSPGYDSAPYKLVIICEDLGSGSFNLR